MRNRLRMARGCAQHVTIKVAAAVLVFGLAPALSLHAQAVAPVASDTLYGWSGMSMTFVGSQQLLLGDLEERAGRAGLPFAKSMPLGVGFGGAVWMGRWQLSGNSTLLYAGAERDRQWQTSIRGSSGTVQIGYALRRTTRTRWAITTGIGRASVRSTWSPRRSSTLDEVLSAPGRSTVVGVTTWTMRGGLSVERRVVVFGERLALMSSVGWQGPVSGSTRSVADEVRIVGAPRLRQEGAYFTLGIGLPIRARDAFFAALGSALPGGAQ